MSTNKGAANYGVHIMQLQRITRKLSKYWFESTEYIQDIL